MCFWFQAEDGIRDLVRSRGLGDVYKRQTGRFAYDPIGTSMFADPFTLQVAEVRMVSAGFLLSLIHI